MFRTSCVAVSEVIADLCYRPVFAAGWNGLTNNLRLLTTLLKQQDGGGEGLKFMLVVIRNRGPD